MWVEDLHKHFVDEVTLSCSELRGNDGDAIPGSARLLVRVGLDAVRSDPLSVRERGTIPARRYPANFIAEGLDQTRGWFYTLVVLGTALFDEAPFQNCIVTGMILAEDGRKMSKSLKNYPDPSHVLDEFGADALRAYLINSPVVRADPLRFSENGVREVVRTVLLPFWNAYSFFTTYAEADGITLADLESAAPLEQRRRDRPLDPLGAAEPHRPRQPGDGGVPPLQRHPSDPRIHRRPNQLVYPPLPETFLVTAWC